MAENVNEDPISCCLYLREHRGFFFVVFVFEDLWTWKQKTIFNEDSYHLVLGLVLSPL